MKAHKEMQRDATLRRKLLTRELLSISRSMYITSLKQSMVGQRSVAFLLICLYIYDLSNNHKDTNCGFLFLVFECQMYS